MENQSADNEVITRLKEAKDASQHPGFDYAWYRKVKYPERRFSRCRVLAVGARNIAVIEFLEDGFVVVVNRYSVRRLSSLNPTEKRKVLYAKKDAESVGLDFLQGQREEETPIHREVGEEPLGSESIPEQILSKDDEG